MQPKFETLSIVIPAFNESKTIAHLLDKVVSVQLLNGIAKQIIVIDDASTDGTGERVDHYAKSHENVSITCIRHAINKGKGAALRTGIENANGQFIIIQDADLEYDPADYNAMLAPVFDANADVVYGSRFISGKPHRILFFWHTIGNKFLTFCCNMFCNLNLTDMESCYKLFRADILKSIQLKENRFGFEPEVTIKMSRIRPIRIYEVGIAYYGRTYSEGKKINWKDGFRALYCILRYGLFSSK